MGHRSAGAWKVNTVEAPQSPKSTGESAQIHLKLQNPYRYRFSCATFKFEIYIRAASLNWLLAIDWNGVNFKRIFSSAGVFAHDQKECERGEKPNTTSNKTFDGVFSVEKTSETAGERSDELQKKLFSSAIRSNFLVCCASSDQSSPASISDQAKTSLPRHRKRY